MSRLHTNGPESPLGRRRISTRKTKPFSSCSDKNWIKRLPMRENHSWFERLLGPPTVSPSCSYKKIKSISDERLSSRPPNLPIPTTIKGISALFALLQGSPNRFFKSSRMKAIESATANSAKWLKPWVTSFRLAIPFKSLNAIQIIKRCLAMRRLAINCASSSPISCWSMPEVLSKSWIPWISTFFCPQDLNQSSHSGRALSQRCA